MAVAPSAGHPVGEPHSGAKIGTLKGLRFAHRREQVAEFILGEFQFLGNAFEDPLEKGPLLFLEEEDLFFDRSLGDKFVDEDGVFLPDAVSPVRGLTFQSGVPPWIIMDHCVRRREVQTRASGPEADEEDGNHSGLEFVAQGAAVRRLTVEENAVDAQIVQCGLDQIEHRRELGEYEDFATLFDHRFDQFEEEIQFGGTFGFLCRFESQQLRMAADLAEF